MAALLFSDQSWLLQKNVSAVGIFLSFGRVLRLELGFFRLDFLSQCKNAFSATWYPNTYIVALWPTVCGLWTCDLAIFRRCSVAPSSVGSAVSMLSTVPHWWRRRRGRTPETSVAWWSSWGRITQTCQSYTTFEPTYCYSLFGNDCLFCFWLSSKFEYLESRVYRCWC